MAINVDLQACEKLLHSNLYTFRYFYKNILQSLELIISSMIISVNERGLFFLLLSNFFH